MCVRGRLRRSQARFKTGGATREPVPGVRLSHPRPLYSSSHS